MRRRLIPFAVLLMIFGVIYSRRHAPRSAAPATQPSQSDPRPTPATAAPGAHFDFYLLNLSWSPEYCATHRGAPECSLHAGLVLHGLWPQNNDGTYPEHCSNAPGPADPAAYKDIFPDPGLLRHEWTTHGTCSGLSADAYFTLARRAFHSVVTPPALDRLTAQTSFAPADLLHLVAAANPALPSESLALSCGNNRLTALEVCLSSTLSPSSCRSVRSCRANSIRVTPR